MSELSEEEIARDLFDEMEGPVANQDFGRQQRQWELCQRLAKTALAILQPALERARREGLEAAAQYLEACDDYGDRYKAAEIRAIRKG